MGGTERKKKCALGYYSRAGACNETIATKSSSADHGVSIKDDMPNNLLIKRSMGELKRRRKYGR